MKFYTKNFARSVFIHPKVNLIILFDLILTAAAVFVLIQNFYFLKEKHDEFFSEDRVAKTYELYVGDSVFPLTDKDRETFIGPPMELSLERWFGIRGDKNAEVCSHYRKIYREEKLMVAEPYEGIVKMLTDLKEAGFTLGVASYKKSDYLGRILEGFDLDKFFDVISGSDYSGKLTKSDIIRSSLQTLNIEDKSRVLMVGDTSYDSEGAEGAGIDFCFAERGVLIKFHKRSGLQKILLDRNIIL